MNTFYRTKNNEITKLTLTKRANNSNLPNVNVVDLKHELAMGNKSMISNDLFNAIEKRHFKEFLLYGVTGSGKTEVYLQVIKNIIDQNKSVIVLVPEISLTPQMIDRFIRKIWKRKNNSIT